MISPEYKEGFENMVEGGGMGLGFKLFEGVSVNEKCAFDTSYKRWLHIELDAGHVYKKMLTLSLERIGLM